jgi:eukaryotic-like serine/threonine-protein kinase
MRDGSTATMLERIPTAPHRNRMAPDDLAGKRVGAYVLQEAIGIGGICTVYRGRCPEDPHPRAIKVLQPRYRSNSILGDRLRLEGSIGMSVAHPNLVQVIDRGESEFGPYLVMELLEGETLSSLLARDKRLSTARAALLIRQAAKGIAELHRRGFVHLDIKPGNLIVVPYGGDERNAQLKIIDFGIAESIGVRGSVKVAVGSGCGVTGTPGYIAPEQYQGREVGPPSDLYALGIVLYYLISGRSPFTGPIDKALYQQLAGNPNPLETADGLDEIAFWMLERDPDQRPTVEQLIAALDWILQRARTSR